MTDADIQILPLDAWHRARGARMVPFAGYAMPVQYEGVIAEHLWTRENAGLFDVSHMGQLTFHGAGVDSALETLLPGDLQNLVDGRLRYSMLLDDNGGIIDDLMATRRGDHFYVVVNGATKTGDIEEFDRRLPRGIVLDHLKEQALLALQGPRAAEMLEALAPGVSELIFMQGAMFTLAGAPAWISRSGYTGEDGFEISIPAAAAATVADALTADDRVKPIGLGARDSLRLEAGLPLYGHDLDRETTPVMADLLFAIGKRRRAEGGFPGAARIVGEIDQGPAQKRAGLTVGGRQPVREGALILDPEGNEIGRVTSGTFSPSLQRPIAMGYVAAALSAPGTALKLEQRGKLIDAADLKFAESFDAAFSNATLHWVLDKQRAARAIWFALKFGGRFAGEMGGAGNLATLRQALDDELVARGFGPPTYAANWYPDPDEFVALYEAAGFTDIEARLIERPTELAHGVAAWVTTFRAGWLDRAGVPDDQRAAVADAVAARAGTTTADYVRLRFMMRKPK